MTNRQCHERAAGMNLDSLFFVLNGINPDSECTCVECTSKKGEPTTAQKPERGEYD